MDTINKQQLPGEHPVDWAARVLGGRKALAERLTAYHVERGRPNPVDVAAIGNWKVRGIPLERCVPIEVVTGGIVSRQHTRPEDYFDHWPELAPGVQGSQVHV